MGFEHTSGTGTHQPHTILFVGGLGDGLGTSSYTADIVRALASTRWSLFAVNLSSAHTQWGLGHLDRDTEEAAQWIRYIREYKAAKYGGGGSGKIVVMGHSTGSQCVLSYVSQPNPITAAAPFDPQLEHAVRPAVDGAVMQAPVSDREAIMLIREEGFAGQPAEEIRATLDEAQRFAEVAVKEPAGSIDTIIPLHLTAPVYGTVPVSCRRFLSLLSPDSPQRPGPDDMFSSDLGEDALGKTFGMISERGVLKTKLMVLMSGSDASVPSWVDKEAVLSRWQKIADGASSPGQVWDGVHSGIIPGGSHALSDANQKEARRWLAERLVKYLSYVETT